LHRQVFSRSLLREQAHNTSRDHLGQGGPRKEEKECRRTPSTLSTISRLHRHLGRTLPAPAALHCKYTVEPERFNPQRLIAGIYVWLLPAITCDAQLRVNLADLDGDDGGRRPAECYNMRVIHDIYSFEVTRTLTANSGFPRRSGQPRCRVGRYDEVTLIT
jgi:hypothetical protein